MDDPTFRFLFMTTVSVVLALLAFRLMAPRGKPTSPRTSGRLWLAWGLLVALTIGGPLVLGAWNPTGISTFVSAVAGVCLVSYALGRFLWVPKQPTR